MYAAYSSNQDLTNGESIERKNPEKAGERELQPGESDFTKAMEDIPPFSETPNNSLVNPATAEGSSTITTPSNANESTEGAYSTNNAYGENQQLSATITEKTAASQVASGDINVTHLIQNVAGNAAGGSDAIRQDGSTAETNMSIAKDAADDLSANISLGKTDGANEGNNLLVETMTSAAAMKVATEAAAVETVNQAPNATNTIAEAQKAIERTRDLEASLEQSGSLVQDPHTAANIMTGVEDIEQQITESENLLSTAIEEKSENVEEPEETSNPEANLLDSSDNPSQDPNPQLNSTSESPFSSTPQTAEGIAPGQINANTIDTLRQQREEKAKAAQEATRVNNEQATNERLEGQRF